MLLIPNSWAVLIEFSTSKLEWVLFKLLSCESLKDWPPKLRRLIPKLIRFLIFFLFKSFGFDSILTSGSGEIVEGTATAIILVPFHGAPEKS